MVGVRRPTISLTTAMVCPFAVRNILLVVVSPSTAPVREAGLPNLMPGKPDRLHGNYEWYEGRGLMTPRSFSEVP